MEAAVLLSRIDRSHWKFPQDHYNVSTAKRQAIDNSGALEKCVACIDLSLLVANFKSLLHFV
jgi:hypothetical protein